MPEGDTIHRIANRLAPQLVGKIVERVTTQGLVRDLAGQAVTQVSAHGKHLVIELAGGTYLRAHLGMNGRWRAYERAEGERVLARMSPGRASLAITVADAVFVWIGARTIEVSHRRAPMHGHAIARLGPDILADDFDSRTAAARAAQHGHRRIADVLLDQGICAGIGNIYKCEALFARGIAPVTRVDDLDEPALVALYDAARAQMVANLGPAPRTTRERISGDPAPGDRYMVYGRTGKPCRRCGTAIGCVQLGDPPRWTWSCAHCQPVGAVGGVAR